MDKFFFEFIVLDKQEVSSSLNHQYPHNGITQAVCDRKINK